MARLAREICELDKEGKTGSSGWHLKVKAHKKALDEAESLIKVQEVMSLFS